MRHVDIPEIMTAYPRHFAQAPLSRIDRSLGSPVLPPSKLLRARGGLELRTSIATSQLESVAMSSAGQGQACTRSAARERRYSINMDSYVSKTRGGHRKGIGYGNQGSRRGLLAAAHTRCGRCDIG